MKFFIYVIIFCLFSFVSHADQNDKRLDDLFHLLSHSDDIDEINEATSTIWKIWLEINDPLIENDFNRGLNSMKHGKLNESIEIFSKIIEKRPNFAEAWNKRATVYYLIGDFDSSVTDIKETLKLEPRHFGALDGLGLIFIHLQQFENAIKVYDEMLKIFPNNPSTIQKRKHLMDFISKST